MLVQDVMTARPVTVRASTHVSEALRVVEGRVVVGGPVSAQDRTIATTTVTTVPGVPSVHLAEEERGRT